METQRRDPVVIQDPDSTKLDGSMNKFTHEHHSRNYEGPKPKKLSYESNKCKNKKVLTIILILGGALLLAASGAIAYFLWPKHNTLRVHDNSRPQYNQGWRYQFFYVFKLSESLRLKNQTSPNGNQTSEATFAMNVTVIVEKNDIEDGGNLSMMIGFEPADDSLIDEEPDSNEETEDTFMIYKVVFDENYNIVSITGVSESLTEDGLRYLLALLQQLTPHVRNQLNLPSPRHLRESMTEAQRDELLKEHGQINARGIELPDQTCEEDEDGRKVCLTTSNNDNLIIPSPPMQSRPGVAAPKFSSTERTVIDQEGTLVEDEKSVDLIVGEQDEGNGRNLGEEESEDGAQEIALKAQIYQVTRAEGKLKLICKQETKDGEISETKKVLKEHKTKTVSKADIDKLLLQQQKQSDDSDGEDEGQDLEEPRNLLSMDQIKNRMTAHYPSDFSHTRDSHYIYKKELVNMRLLGKPLRAGFYAGAGYSYLLNAEKFGGFVTIGAGAYIRSAFINNDWDYFLSGGATARFQGNRVIFEIGQLKNGRFTQKSYAKTLTNPWAELSGKIADIFNKEASLVSKFKELIKQAKGSSGSSDLKIPRQFIDFGNQCTDIKRMIEKFLTDDENLHVTQCFDLVASGLRETIQLMDSVAGNPRAPQKVKQLAQKVKEIAQDALPIVERAKAVVNAFEGNLKSIFRSLSLPIAKDLSHLNGRKVLFKVCWPVWVVKVCAEAVSTQKVSSKVAVDIIKLNGEAGPNYEAGIDLNGYVSVFVARAGIRIRGSIASAYLRTEVKQRDNTNLSQQFKIGNSSCMKSMLNLRAISSHILIYYQRRSVRFRCRRWRCRLKVSWKETVLANRPLLRGSNKSIRLINTC